ncbi:hypothetical protein V6R21_30315 [Limibacter armeniacum]|uniref:hypothetical protein n=1 Tax=Limibacter armeniacum TaxID=466084 RepID=UPI002FE68DEE
MAKSTVKPNKVKIMRVIARLNVGGPAIHTILLTDRLNNDSFETKLVSGTVSAEEGERTIHLTFWLSLVLAPEMLY